jgi:predicted alpha/beta hydrolase family esterase
LKKAVILHGTDGSPQENWFAWLKTRLEEKGYEVWVPQLPKAEEPNTARWTRFLLSTDWDFNDNLLIGHSAGAVEILDLLQHLDEDVKLEAAILVGVFSEAITKDPDWSRLKNLFNEPFAFSKIKTKASRFLVVHGDDDPWCDPKEAESISQKLSSEFVSVPGGQHFSASLDPGYTKFPKLIEILESRQLI